MNAIDFHAHAFPDALAKRAIATLEAGCPWKAFGDGTVSALLASMDAAGVDVSAVCPIATRPGQEAGILKWCREIRSSRIVPLPSVHPDSPDAVKWIDAIADEGFTGVKLHPMYQQFAFDEQRVDPIYQAARRRGIFIAAHCGLDIAYPPDDDRADPRRFRRVLDRHEGLMLVCTHMGGWRAWDLSMKYLVGQAVYLETSMSLAELGPQRAADMIRRHGPDRVMFGTDWPWDRQKEQVQAVVQLGLSDEDTGKILRSNAAKLLKCPPCMP